MPGSSRGLRRLPAGPGATGPADASPALPPTDSLLRLLGFTWPGRVLLGSLAARLLIAVLADPAAPLTGPLWGVSVVVSVSLGLTLLWFVWHALGIARRRLLWRVRRKLILSYVFIGVVPALLIIAFFLFAGLLMFFHVSAYLFKRSIDDVVDEAAIVASAAALELSRAANVRNAPEVFERRLAGTPHHPGLSLALVPRAERAAPPVAVGPWRHADVPETLPPWIGEEGFRGLLAFAHEQSRDDTGLVIRAVALPDVPDPAFAIVADVPVDAAVIASLRAATGIELRGVEVVAGADVARPQAARAREQVVSIADPAQTGDGPWGYNSVTIFEFVDWTSGRPGTLLMSIRVSVRDIYDRISAAQSRIGNLRLGDLFMAVLGAIAVLFLVIEIVALVMGFVLARSITGAVHELFEGTARVRAGDFTHRIRVRSRDQLGELAESFNEMTGSVQALLLQKAEKERLEEELRIARDIQMSLLPRGPLHRPGLAVTALCVPAREVGGDYYDFFPLDDHRFGVLIADVAGKGTSAALYMAELKGVVLSLSRVFQSPKPLLVEVNRVISSHLDSRSFITMTYAVVDLRERTLTYARAGHTPLIYLPSPARGRQPAQVLVPDGMVLGLRIEGVAAKFGQLLEESVVRFETGDVFVFFTDGVTEAMNVDADLFGETRLQELVEAHGHLSSDELRERILREVEAFVGQADAHDDMTMILLKVEEPTAPEVVDAPAAHVAV